MILLIIILVIGLTTAGQIFLKIGAKNTEGSPYINKHVLTGYIFLVFTVILSYFLMKIIPMKHFTVIMSLNYIAVLFAAKLFLNENINRDRITGTILIAVGVSVFLL